jgi:hemerythrin-like domain-containing protein
MAHLDRRQFITAGVIAAAIGVDASTLHAKDEPQEKEVEAAEDLMREHGVLRRALLVYTIASARLRDGGEIPADALAQTAQLFRQFGEEYHERTLEEKYVFPDVARSSTSFAQMADLLKTQHERGREITNYLITVTRSGRVAPANTASLAKVLDGFVLMYRHHAAIEDTVIFPAWKESVSSDDYHELSERFEELEHKMFGADGFEDAVKRIAGIEEAFGLADLAALTAPKPPTPA